MSTPTAVTLSQIEENKITSHIYSLIRDSCYEDVIRILSSDLPLFPRSRAMFSLLGYCYYQIEDFEAAARCYEKLSALCPDNEDYKVYQAQSWFKAGNFSAVGKLSYSVNKEESKKKMNRLLAATKYEMNDLAACKMMLEQSEQDDADVLMNQACLLQKMGKIEDAARKYQDLIRTNGYKPDICYNLASCHYELKQYDQALKHLVSIIDHELAEHPEYGVDLDDSGENRFINNSETLHETHLIEAFNLKAAIEYRLSNINEAKEAFKSMPQRMDLDLDAVTLHNEAILSEEEEAAVSFEKLTFLLYQNPSPPTTFTNLLMLYLKYDYTNLAADLMAEHPLPSQQMPPMVKEFVDAIVMKSASLEDSFAKLDDLNQKHLDQLRKLAKQVQEARARNDNDQLKLKIIHQYDDVMALYLPVLMAQAKCYWDQGQYIQAEKFFRKSVEYCNESSLWKANVGHVLFMQEKYQEAITFYEPISKKKNLVDITPIVLANLCVCFIMTSQNELAEELMRRLEKEEEQISFDEPQKRLYHLCIINLVIGTLYCSKGNYEFGIARIIKSLEPFNKKLGTETWHYAKRCFISFLETLSKQMLLIKASVLQDCIAFFDQCELYGKDIPTIVDPLMQVCEEWDASTSVSHEARKLKSMYLEWIGQ